MQCLDAYFKQKRCAGYFAKNSLVPNLQNNTRQGETEREGQERETERETETTVANGKTVPVERGWMP